MDESVSYEAFLVRLWPTRRGGVDDYRVTVQSISTGESRTFADLAGLMAFWQALRQASEDGDASQAGDTESSTGHKPEA